jgi:hypothetical protein
MQRERNDAATALPAEANPNTHARSAVSVFARSRARLCLAAPRRASQEEGYDEIRHEIEMLQARDRPRRLQLTHARAADTPSTHAHTHPRVPPRSLLRAPQECAHPNVVRYYGSSVGRDYLWIVMEYCGGGARILPRADEHPRLRVRPSQC